jgi:hypothetical protein
MTIDQILQLVLGRVTFFNRFAKPVKNLFGFIPKELNQDIVLVFEVQINGSIRDTRFFGNLGDGRLKESLLGKYLDGRLENPMILIVEFLFGINGTRSLLNQFMNECSFIFL